MASNYVPSLPNDTLLDQGVLYVNGVAFGATVGGTSFDPGRVVTQLEFDGNRADIAGLDRITDWKSVIKGKILPFNTGSLVQIEPGSSNNFVASSGSLTPATASAFFSSNQYLNNVRLSAPRGNGTWAHIMFPMALVGEYKLGLADKKGGEIDVTFTAKLNPTGSSDACPYFIALTSTNTL